MSYTKYVIVVLVFAHVNNADIVTGCKQNKFTCGDGSCINYLNVCDDSFDCSDKSDELGCSITNKCPEGLIRNVRCKNGKCVKSGVECENRNTDSLIVSLTAKQVERTKIIKELSTKAKSELIPSSSSLILNKKLSSKTIIASSRNIVKHLSTTEIMSSMFIETNSLSMYTPSLESSSTKLYIISSSSDIHSTTHFALSTAVDFYFSVSSVTHQTTSSPFVTTEFKEHSTLLPSSYYLPFSSHPTSAFSSSADNGFLLSSHSKSSDTIVSEMSSKNINDMETNVSLFASSSSGIIDNIDMSSTKHLLFSSSLFGQNIIYLNSSFSSQNDVTDLLRQASKQVSSTRYKDHRTSIESINSSQWTVVNLQSSTNSISISTDGIISSINEFSQPFSPGKTSIMPSMFTMKGINQISTLPSSSFLRTTLSQTTTVFVSQDFSVFEETKPTHGISNTTSKDGFLPKDKNKDFLYISIGVIITIFIAIYIAVIFHCGLNRRKQTRQQYL